MLHPPFFKPFPNFLIHNNNRNTYDYIVLFAGIIKCYGNLYRQYKREYALCILKYLRMYLVRYFMVHHCICCILFANNIYIHRQLDVKFICTSFMFGNVVYLKMKYCMITIWAVCGNTSPVIIVASLIRTASMIICNCCGFFSMKLVDTFAALYYKISQLYR